MTSESLIKSGISIAVLFLLSLWGFSFLFGHNGHGVDYFTNPTRISQVELFHLPLNSTDLALYEYPKFGLELDKENYHNVKKASELINNIYGYKDFVIYSNVTNDRLSLAFLGELNANKIVFKYLDDNVLQLCNNNKDKYVIYIVNNDNLNVILKCHKSIKFDKLGQPYLLILEKLKNTGWLWDNSVTQLLQYDRISEKVLKVEYL